MVNTLDPFGKPFGAGAKKTQVIDLLKSLPVPAVTGHIANQQHHGRRVLKSRVHADRCIGSTRPSRDHADTGPPGQLAVRFGHKSCTTLLATGYELDLVTPRMQTIEYGKIAFTRYAKCMGNALGQKAVNEKMAGKLCCHARIVPPCGQGLRMGLFGRAVVPISPASFQGLTDKFFIAQRCSIFERCDFFKKRLGRLLVLKQHLFEFLLPGFCVYRI